MNKNCQERNNIARDIIAIRNLKSISKEQKDNLIKNLFYEKEPKHTTLENKQRVYNDLLKTLTPEQKIIFKENVRVTSDGKIEIIKEKKMLSMLDAQHNGKDIVNGCHVDHNGDTGIKPVTYLTILAANNECKKQGKNLFKNKEEIDAVINAFPGERIKDKIFNFIVLLGLDKAGCWNPNNDIFYDVGDTAYVTLSNLVKGDNIYEIVWYDDLGVDYIDIKLQGVERYAQPVLVYEDC